MGFSFTFYTTLTWAQDDFQGFSTHAVVFTDKRALITSPIDAMIAEIHIEDGKRFEKHDTLMDFDCTVIGANRDKAAAIVKEKKALLSSSRRLLKLGGGNQQDVATNQSKYDQALADFKTSNYYFKFCHMKAPFNGQTIKLYVHQHERVKKGDKLYEILGDGALKVRFFIPSTWLAWIKKGDDFKLQINETKKNYAAQVTHIVYAVDAVSRTTMVIAKVTEADDDLHPGMSGDAILKGPTDGQ